MIVATVPIRIESSLNLREHWTKRAKRNTSHRAAVFFGLREAANLAPSQRAALLPCVVTITRIAPRALDDDNNVGGAKSIRDGIADWFGLDDRDPRIRWAYAQERGAPKHYAARIEVSKA